MPFHRHSLLQNPSHNHGPMHDRFGHPVYVLTQSVGLPPTTATSWVILPPTRWSGKRISMCHPTSRRSHAVLLRTGDEVVRYILLGLPIHKLTYVSRARFRCLPPNVACCNRPPSQHFTVQRLCRSSLNVNGVLLC